ncbi:MAG: vWA domain-containing protein [Thiotrichaceae bacterium]|nr:vWA domain-containing protein [Thiotrichaceae bacterium]
MFFIKNTLRFAIFFTSFILCHSTYAADDIECKDGKVCRIKSTFLPLRALPRPMSNLYEKPESNAKVIASNVKAFWPMYVFERKDIDLTDPANPTGWYKVGTMVDDPFAWMQAKDILEWKQALIVSYTHHGEGDERRNPVLLFKTKDGLSELVESDDSKRKSAAQDIYDGLKKSPVTVPDEVISREPERFVSIEDKFYMLPVIDFEEVDIFLDETRYLQLAAAIPVSSAGDAGSRAEQGNEDTLENVSFAKKSAMTETIEGTDIQNLVFDIKFVMDMTSSMTPYIETTKEVMGLLAEQVAMKSTEGQIKYGLVGYRDDIKTVPELEFTAKNFTPNELVTEETFKTEILPQAKAANVGSVDYPEEVFAGVQEAITSQWSENSKKFIVLIGDASSHLVGHPQNTTGTNASEIRALANTENIRVIAIHLKDSYNHPEITRDQSIAKSQYSQLSSNPGSEEPAYLSLVAGNTDEFEKIIKDNSTTLGDSIAGAKKGNLASLNNPQQASSTTISSNANSSSKASQIAQSLAANALVEYLGKEATPPRDITAWVMDRDLIDPELESLEVRVLLKKSELNDLIMALEKVQKAIKRGIATQMQFFDALQSVVASTAQGQNISFEGAKRVSDAGLLPSWIDSLPYRSKVLEMSNERFESLTADERSTLENEVDSKLELYRKINENSDLWVELDERDASDDHVYPLSLTALP